MPWIKSIVSWIALSATILIASCTEPGGTPFTNETFFENSDSMQSAPYDTGISWWQSFATQSNNLAIEEFGMTDAGYPLHVITLSSERVKLEQMKTEDKTILLINNAIHPGEPDGVDASMMLFRDILARHEQLLDSVILVCIPYFNIGGTLNRNGHSRANQNGPLEYGFRGNAQNLDLNRDFIKCDSRNAQSFAQLLQLIDPDVYIETHVSNGADYQHTISYLSTQPQKLGYTMGTYLSATMIPALESKMESRDQKMVPYVNIHGGPLDDHYTTFYDSPRYSSGLTTLHHIYGFITETHMLKPFKNRVTATYDYLLSSVEFCYEHSSELRATRSLQSQNYVEQSTLPVDWQIDTSNTRMLDFDGYEFGYKASEVTNSQRLYYDRAKPISKPVKFIQGMKASSHVTKPTFYYLRKGFLAVEDRLRWNGVELLPLKNDTTIEVQSMRISSFETRENPYEGHYLHYNSLVDLDTISWNFKKGDYIIPLGTSKDRFIIETLEPSGPDSYFNWNFFDAVLQQKEYYSSYVFEDKAAEYLASDTALNARFQEKKKGNAEFSKNAQAQLHWIYTQTKHYEKEHMRLPVFRAM